MPRKKTKTLRLKTESITKVKATKPGESDWTVHTLGAPEEKSTEPEFVSIGTTKWLLEPTPEYVALVREQVLALTSLTTAVNNLDKKLRERDVKNTATTTRMSAQLELPLTEKEQKENIQRNLDMVMEKSVTPKKEVTLTTNEVVLALQRVGAELGVEEARKVLASFGATRVPELKADKYADFVEACNVQRKAAAAKVNSSSPSWA